MFGGVFIRYGESGYNGQVENSFYSYFYHLCNQHHIIYHATKSNILNKIKIEILIIPTGIRIWMRGFQLWSQISSIQPEWRFD